MKIGDAVEVLNRSKGQPGNGVVVSVSECGRYIKIKFGDSRHKKLFKTTEVKTLENKQT